MDNSNPTPEKTVAQSAKEILLILAVLGVTAVIPALVIAAYRWLL